MKVFVYGTLLKGMERGQVLATSKYLGPAVINAKLYDLGVYPGLKEGRDEVVGEVYEINDQTLGRLDKIEGYNHDNISHSLFIRKEIEVRDFAKGNRFKAFTYYYNHSIGIGSLISDGDYRRYCLEKEDSRQWILAYGSNTSSQRLRDRVGDLSSLKKGYLQGYSLVFNKVSDKSGTCANIAYTGSNDKCPAIAFQLSAKQIDTLDRCEGVPKHYLRISIPFWTEAGEEIVQTYIAHPDKLAWGKTPKSQYLDYIQRGYEEHGFDKEYLEKAIMQSRINTG